MCYNYYLADSNPIVEEVTGKQVTKLKLKDAHTRWSELFPGYSDLGDTTRKFNESVFQRLLARADEHNLTYIEDVAPAKALEYAKNLWEDNFTAKTYNTHLAHLSRIFSTRDAVNPLSHRDPFSPKNVPRKKKSEFQTAGHQIFLVVFC